MPRRPAARPSLDERDRTALVNVSLVPWNEATRKRNQAIFLHLLADTPLFTRGLYVNPPRTPLDGRPRPPARSPRRIAGRPFEIVQPFYPIPFSHRPFVREAAAAACARWLRRLVSGEPYTLWINSVTSHSYYLVKALRPAAAYTVMDLSDDFRTFAQHGRRPVAARIAECARLADKLLAVNRVVADSVEHPDKLVLQNGVEYEIYQSLDPHHARPPFWPKPAGTQYVGFIGGISRTKTDLPLLERLFRALPTVTFLFVGFVDEPGLAGWLDGFPNAHFVPTVPHAELPAIVSSFDVAIVPHQINDRTRGNDLLKVMDYLAAGAPIVATPCSGLEALSPPIVLASSADEFVHRVRQVLDARGYDSAPGKAIARARSWTNLAGELAAWLSRPAAHHRDLAAAG
jgi:glycosyltransferase involved in cell wall biosynthesis